MFLRVCCALLFCLTLSAQDAPLEKPKSLTADQVVAMVKAGLSEDVIVARLRREEKAFDLSPDDLIRLKAAGVSDEIVKTMLDPKAPFPPPVAPSQPVVVAPNPGGPGVVAISGSANPSGATPLPGTNPRVDPNDPTQPHDSGIYLLSKNRDGLPQMILLDRAAIQGTRSGGLLVPMLTQGLGRTRVKAQIQGLHAAIRANQPDLVFYFYFEDKPAGLGKSYFGLGSLSNPNQFALLKLSVTKTSRETVISSTSAFGSSTGNDLKSMIPFKSERIRPGLYKVTAERVPEGEYCFLSHTTFGTSANAVSDLFDFGVTVH
jgi:hypothetical protein